MRDAVTLAAILEELRKQQGKTIQIMEKHNLRLEQQKTSLTSLLCNLVPILANELWQGAGEDAGSGSNASWIQMTTLPSIGALGGLNESSSSWCSNTSLDLNMSPAMNLDLFQ